MQSPDENQLICPGPSLWNLITEHVHGSEMPKIRTALGHSLVDMYTELHSEAEMCHKMWQESHPGGNHGSRVGATLPSQQGAPLPDPPAVKELLRAEVKMLLQTLSERASRVGRDGEELLLQYNSDTVYYALGHLDSHSTACTSPREVENGSKTENQIRPSSHCSVQSIIEDEIDAVRDKLNVTDIDQVVDRLKSVMLAECDALKRLVQHLKENINQKYKCKSGFPKPEPTLVELRELREAVQMDLNLYPSSLDASPPDLFQLPVKEMKNKFRVSAGRMASDDTLHVLTAASVLRPHPPPPLSHVNPRPPAGHRHTKLSASVRPVQTSSLSGTPEQHRKISSICKSVKAPACNKITTSEHVKSHFTNKQHSSVSLEQDSAGLHRRDLASCPRLQRKSQRSSPVHEAHLYSHPSLSECDLSPRRERKGSVWRRNLSINPSGVPAQTSVCAGAGSYISNSTEHSVSKTGDLKTQNGHHKSTCRGSLVSTAVQRDKSRINVSSERFHSLAPPETEGAPSQNYSAKSNGGNGSGHLEKDVNQQQSQTDFSSHHSGSNGKQGQNKCGQPVCIRLNGKVSTSLKKPLEGITAQDKSVQEAQTGIEMIRFYQPVPPARMLI